MSACAECQQAVDDTARAAPDVRAQVLERARREQAVDVRGLNRHVASCRWCQPVPCHAAVAAARNVARHAEHVARLEAVS